MKVIFLTLLLALASGVNTAHGQPELPTFEQSSQWVLSRMDLYGRLRNMYTVTVDDLQQVLSLKTVVATDSSAPYGIMVSYHDYSRDHKKTITVIKQFRLTDIVYVNETELYGERSLQLHVDSAKITSITGEGPDRDTMVVEGRPHSVVDIVLRWRGERRLYKAMYKRLTEIAEINKSKYNRYAIYYRAIDRFCKHR